MLRRSSVGHLLDARHVRVWLPGGPQVVAARPARAWAGKLWSGDLVRVRRVGEALEVSPLCHMSPVEVDHCRALLEAGAREIERSGQREEDLVFGFRPAPAPSLIERSLIESV